ncbi:MAG: hypothetical protein L0207_06085 [Chlamydiae bacterium]|nr:hypothetical protein [Chlamydiota bacterium]
MGEIHTIDLVNLFLGKEAVMNSDLYSIAQEMKENNVKLEKIQEFLTRISHDSAGGKKVDYNSDPQMRELAFEISKICPGSIEVGNYAWDSKSMPTLIKAVENKISPIQTKINELMTHSYYKQSELHQILQIVQGILNDVKRLIHFINGNSTSRG